MYSRRVVKDYETVMNKEKELYDNLQDGIDESKQAISELEESLAETKQDFSSQLQEGMGGIRYDPSRDMIMVQNQHCLLGQVLLCRRDFLIVNPRDFRCQPGGHGNPAVPKDRKSVV